MLQELRAAHPTLPVLVLSVHPEDQYAVQALRAGARGYLTKDHSPEELVANDCPKGFGANHNAAFGRSASKIFFVVNPDIRLPDNPFPALMESLEGENVAAAGPLVRNATGQPEDSARRFPTVARLLQKMAATSNADLVRYVATNGLMR